MDLLFKGSRDKFILNHYPLQRWTKDMAGDKISRRKGGPPMADNQKAVTGPQKAKKTRSPSHPVFGLEEAIRRARALHASIYGHSVGVETIAQIWGTNIKSSAYMQALSTLLQFGLLVDEGKGENRRVKLSDLGQDILVQEDGSPEQRQLIKQAALLPKLHRELWMHYRGDLPPSDAPIRVYLLREREGVRFHPEQVGDFISQFRGTIQFAELDESDTILPAGDAAGDTTIVIRNPPPSAGQPGRSALGPPNPPKPELGAVGASRPPDPAGFRDLPVTLPSLEIAVLRVPVPMTEEDYQTLTGALAAMKKALVRECNPNVPPSHSPNQVTIE